MSDSANKTKNFDHPARRVELLGYFAIIGCGLFGISALVFAGGDAAVPALMCTVFSASGFVVYGIMLGFQSVINATVNDKSS